MSGIFSFVRFFRRTEWALSVLVVLMIVLQVWFELEIPNYMAAITDVITSHGTSEEVLEKSFAMVGCAVATLIIGLLVSSTVGWISSSTAKTIRQAEFDHVQKFSLSEIDRISTYSLITRSTNDVKQVQDFIGVALESLIRAPIISIWAILRISQSDMTWTAATVISIFAMILLVITILRLTAPLYRKVQKLNDGINAVTMEMLTGQRVIRAYNADDLERNKFEAANDALTQNHIRAARIMGFNVPMNGFIRNGLAMTIYWLGAFIIAGTSSEPLRLELFSEMIVFSTYAILALNGFRTMVQIFNVFPRAQASLDRIFEVLDTDLTIVGGTVTDGDRKGSISFRDVSFRYMGSSADVLSGISFDVNPGETVAVIGATGCGKTSLMNLIPRFYDCNEGKVLVDGIDVKEYDLDSLRSKIGYVSQRPTILSGSVRDNVNYGKGSENRTDDDIWSALETACIKDFIEDSGGLGINLSEEGRNISGGQKQRVAIARAICKAPEIYVFDDCFSAIDFRTDLEVRRRLKRRTEGSTVVLVTQRIGTARGADRIIVLDKGRIVGQGTHEELLDGCALYREIAESQRTGDEL
ncbi:MAG: ABC transporter ATP-binding protein [Candidatus Methanomethylophilaceae archaeon]|nr:ABC transporter ATP-binding protein [Candidatus Methanomethylophilaceae archaeon]